MNKAKWWHWALLIISEVLLVSLTVFAVLHIVNDINPGAPRAQQWLTAIMLLLATGLIVVVRVNVKDWQKYLMTFVLAIGITILVFPTHYKLIPPAYYTIFIAFVSVVIYISLELMFKIPYFDKKFISLNSTQSQPQ